MIWAVWHDPRWFFAVSVIKMCSCSRRLQTGKCWNASLVTTVAVHIVRTTGLLSVDCPSFTTVWSQATFRYTILQPSDTRTTYWTSQTHTFELCILRRNGKWSHWLKLFLKTQVIIATSLQQCPIGFSSWPIISEPCNIDWLSAAQATAGDSCALPNSIVWVERDARESLPLNIWNHTPVPLRTRTSLHSTKRCKVVQRPAIFRCEGSESITERRGIETAG